MRHFALTILLLGACATAAMAADVAAPREPLRPQERLAHLGSVMRQLDYKGVFSYEQNGSSASVQWVHAVRDGVEHERMLGLDGAHRELLRERPAGCMQGGERMANERLIQSLSGDLSALESYYNFSYDQPTLIAGRTADVVLVAARDEFRFGYRLAMDHETGLLLGVELLDARSNVIERFRFVTVQIGNVAPSDLLPVTAKPEKIDAGNCQQNAAVKPAVAPWKIDLPPGYSLCSHEQRDHDEDAMVFSDGLASFSVFVHQRDDDHDESAAHEVRGNTTLESQHLEMDGKPYVVTVVGEVPQATVKRVFGSLASSAGAASR